MIIKPHFDLYATHISNEMGYGVFTNEFIKSGSIVETSYCVPVNPIMEWSDYKYMGNGSSLYMPLGFAVIYNHSDNPNIGWRIIGERLVEFFSIRDINVGDELRHSYGENYWKQHGRKKIM
jgi:SET domain-containing protein